MATGMHDAINGNFFDIGPRNDVEDDLLSHEGIEYDKFFEFLHSPLYDGYKEFSALSFFVKLMNIKVLS